MQRTSLTLNRRSFIKAGAHLLALVADFSGRRMTGVVAQVPAPVRAYGVGAYGGGAYGQAR